MGRADLAHRRLRILSETPARISAEKRQPFAWRNGVTSAGIALRVNLLGFAVGQFDFSHPFQRPGRGWIFQFNLSPGW